MTDRGTDRRPGVARTWFDVGLILVISLLAEIAHFSWRDGRSVLNGDSIQYVDAGEALLSPDKGPDFAVRKPGYPFILAGIALLVGNMSWAAVAANHLFQGLLPLAAYGLGRNLRSRFVGWVAALLTVAYLQTHVQGDRIMSEAAYMLLLTVGAVALAAGLKGACSLRLMASAGLLLALAWSVRSVAVAVIIAGLACTVWVLRGRPGRAAIACLCLTLPLAAAVLFECSLNLRFSGQFRPSTGSLGLMLMMRTRHLQGLPMPDSEIGRYSLALLPDRDPPDAYRASEVDTWVARYRAVHDHGLDDWEVDSLMKRGAFEIVRAHPVEFFRCSFDLFVRHLLRQREIPSHARMSHGQQRPFVMHPAAADDPDFQEHWYAFWGLPNRTLEESLDLAARMKTAAGKRAPFARTEPLPTLRYVSMLPPVADVLGVLRGVARLWPGFALILCGILGLNRRTCAFLAAAYVLEAILISICCPSESAAIRYQCVWLATDITLAAAFVSVPLQLVWSRLE